jgi:hypothetical protein
MAIRDLDTPSSVQPDMLVQQVGVPAAAGPYYVLAIRLLERNGLR